ncbi:MAG: N-methyl-D-aspartate receptor NMDAR2C subunit [Candidatus Micrarchaeota archaeon]|nr:N-methyl-D-aspartate receptor NMDAR2C subunit [Candidatus Micrarchaeota archaeon]
MEKTLSADALESRFATLWKGLGGADNGHAPHYSSLSHSYSSRPYHNLDHIASCLNELDKVGHLVNDKKAIEFALYFHDAIYDSKRKDNEEKSAEWATSLAQGLGQGEKFIRSVERMILATKHTGNPIYDWDTRYMVDIDLSILAQPKVIFDRYEKNVRKEYSWVPAADYKKGRSNVLKGFLERQSIYSTEFFALFYEARARENLKRALRSL